MENKKGSRMDRNASRYKSGNTFGSWTLVSNLGKGGNGEVWRASKQGVPEHAIKLLKFDGQVRYQRFREEIAALSMLKGVSGVIPLVEECLPASSKGEILWFVMPIAETFDSYSQGKTAKVIVEKFAELADTLAMLHSKKIAHRDIKLANILVHGGRLCFSDFGLVKYPKRTPITPKRQDVGPKFTMAPEMRRFASSANGIPADVYSFSKSLWVALTGNRVGFDGQYHAMSVVGLKNHISEDYTTTLDCLLTECTDNDPTRRPPMTKVAERLREWLHLIDDFHVRNLTEWVEVQRALFPTGSPERASWTQIDAICSVLHELAKVRSLNHMFYPSRGGNTITGVSRAAEPGMIALHIDEKIAVILKPQKLSYESFGNNSVWNYFRLEAAPVNAIGINGAMSSDGMYEALTEVAPGNYESYDHWDQNDCGGEPLPDFSRPVTRYLNGAFVFFSTRSIYNRNPATYDARHNMMGEQEFREYIEKVSAHYEKQASNNSLQARRL